MALQSISLSLSHPPPASASSSVRPPHAVALIPRSSSRKQPLARSRKSSRYIVNMAPEEEKVTRRSPLDLPQEDVSYLIKLGAGSVAGAAAIKYGSIIFPEITRPNLLQAMTMISAPVLVAVLLLIRQSSAD